MLPYDSGCCFRGSCAPNHPRVLWELNTSCNLHCSWCHARPHMESGLQTSEIIAGLGTIKKCGFKGVIFSGGEPLLRKDLMELIKAASKLGLEIDLCTNASLINAACAKDLSLYLSEISVSIDSANPATHDRLRGTAGAFQKAAEGIKQLVQAGLEVHAITLCCNDTIHELDDTIKLLSDMNVHSVTLLGLIQIEGNDTGISFSSDSREYLISEIPGLRSKYPAITINTKRILRTESQQYCSAGHTIFGIDARGNLMACILLKDKVRSITLKELEGFENLQEVGKRLLDQDGEACWSKCAR